MDWNKKQLSAARWASTEKTGKATQDFNIQDKLIEDAAMKKILRNDEIHLKASRSLDDLCPRPLPGEQWRIVTEKAFNAYAFIGSLLSDGDIEDLHMAIYRINEPTVLSLRRLIDEGRIRRATFIISSFFQATKRPEVWAQTLAAYCAANPERCSFAYLHNHAKVVCVRNARGCYVFEGSGNMSDNARVEQYTYECCEQTYTFHCSWMDGLIAAAKKKSDEGR